MKIQRTIEDIYEVLRKQNRSTNSSLAASKGLRLTKLIVFSGKDLIWSIDLISTNKYDYEFMKCL